MSEFKFVPGPPRKAMIHKAKELYKLWIYRGIKDSQLTINGDEYRYEFCGWTVVLNSNGTLNRMEEPNG